MLSINISELLLTVLNFFILMFALDRLLYRPVIRFRQQRQSRMEESYRQESLARERQSQAQEEAEQQRLASLKQAQAMAAQAQAGEERQAAEEQMEREIQAAMAQAAEDTEALCAAGRESLEQRHHELARTLADRLAQ